MFKELDLIKQGEKSVSSLEIVEQINLFRNAEGKTTILKHSDFLKIIRDEFEEELQEGKISSSFRISKLPNGGSKNIPYFELTFNQAKQLLMRESKFVRKKVIEYIDKLEQLITEQLSPMTTAQMFALQAKAMLEMEERMNVMEEKINFVYEQYQNGHKQLSLLPLSEEPMPEQSIRSRINELVRSYATMVGADYKDVWIRVYKDLYYRYGVSVNAIKPIKNREAKLDKLERTGNLSKVHTVISEMIRIYQSNSIF